MAFLLFISKKSKMLKKITSIIFLLSINIFVFGQPVASFSVTGNFCTGDTISFTNTSSSYTISYWDFGDNTDTWQDNPQHIYTQSGTFTITLTVYDASGNSDQTTQSITIAQTPDVTLSQNTFDQSLTAHSSTNGVSFSWIFNGDTTDATDSTIFYLESGNYKVIVTSTEGCSADTSVDISLSSSSTSASDSLSIVVRNNILTPGVADGANDVLFIDNLSSYANPCSIVIYNKWGQLVYKNDDYSNLGGFDGHDNNGRELDPGTYYYIIKSQGKKTATGYIDLIR